MVAERHQFWKFKNRPGRSCDSRKAIYHFELQIWPNLFTDRIIDIESFMSMDTPKSGQEHHEAIKSIFIYQYY